MPGMISRIFSDVTSYRHFRVVDYFDGCHGYATFIDLIFLISAIYYQSALLLAFTLPPLPRQRNYALAPYLPFLGLPFFHITPYFSYYNGENYYISAVNYADFGGIDDLPLRDFAANSDRCYLIGRRLIRAIFDSERAAA